MLLFIHHKIVLKDVIMSYCMHINASGSKE